MALTQITSIGIKDGEIVNADLSSGAAIALSKLSISGTGSSSNFLRGDGSWQTVPAGISLSGSTNNTIATVTGANALQGEANLTFDGNNLDINGAPWTVTGGNWRNLSISGEGSGASGFLWLGNGAAATNADFDLARVNICNGATIVSQIAGSTQTSANDDGRLSFQTKVTGGSLTEKLRITSAGRINIGGSDVNSYSAHSAVDDLVVGGTSSHGITVLTGNSGTGNLWFDSVNGDRGYIQYAHNEEALILGTENNERLRITNNGLKVGTTVDNNYAAIHAHGGSATRLHLTSSNTGTTTSDGAIIMIDSSSNMEILNKENTNLEFFTNNTERLRITSDGEVLIGATSQVSNEQFNLLKGTAVSGRSIDPLTTALFESAECRLQLQSDNTGSNASALILSNDNKHWLAQQRAGGESNKFQIGYYTGTATDLCNQTTNHLTIKTDGSTGLGTENPGGLLHLYKASAGSVGTIDGGSDDLIIENSTSAGLAFKVPNSERSTITFAAPGTGGQNEAWIQYAHESVSTVADRRCMMFRVGGGEKMRIDSGGRLGINQSPSVSQLEVAHTGTSSPVNQIELNTPNVSDGGGSGIFFKNSGATGSSHTNRYGSRIHTVRGSNGASTFVVSNEKTGGTTGLIEAFKIDSDQRVFKPQQPRFAIASGNNLQNSNSSYWGDGSGGSAGTGRYFVIQTTANGGNAVPVNVGNHYDGSSGNNRGRFTVPVAGTYFFYLSASMADNDSHFIELTVNGSALGNTIMLQYDSTFQTGTLCQLFTLSANDYVQVRRRGNNYDMYSVCWGGWLVA